MKLFVIGGGISGLATAFRLKQAFAARREPLDLSLLESEDRLGGKIFSEAGGGYLMEWGPNGFLDSKPDALELCRELGLEGELLPSRDSARKRFIFSRGKLHRVPESPPAFFLSPLLSLTGRLRILKEPWAPVTPAGLDTTVAEFGSRRLGREAMERLLDPMVSGIFAGDPSVMSLASCFPPIAEMEREHGSLIRAMVALARRRKAAAGKGRVANGPAAGAPRPAAPAGPAGPGGTLTSLKGGMGRLVEVLEGELGDAVMTGVRVERILPAGPAGEARGGGYRVRCRGRAGPQEFRADAVILATPAYASSWILQDLDPAVSRLLLHIPYSPVAVAGLGFDAGSGPGPLDGFGFLVPHEEGLPLLGSLWTSSIFPGRAPQGKQFTRNMLGGWRNGWILSRGDAELEEQVLDVFARALPARGRVEFLRVIRHVQAIPLYKVGHEARLRRIGDLLARHPGIWLTGNAYRGVALNDCVREARVTARRVLERLVGDPGSQGAPDGG